LQRDLEALSVKLADLGDVAAVVIDPITAYLGEVDSHRNGEVRALLAPLSDLAAQHGTAIIGVSHLNKSAGTEALMRVTGSLAFVAATRAAYLVAQDPENPSRRFFLRMKNNLGPESAGLAFSIDAATVASRAFCFGAGNTPPLGHSGAQWCPNCAQRVPFWPFER
jgi:putative DNA primase/helicase